MCAIAVRVFEIDLSFLRDSSSQCANTSHALVYLINRQLMGCLTMCLPLTRPCLKGILEKYCYVVHFALNFDTFVFMRSLHFSPGHIWRLDTECVCEFKPHATVYNFAIYV